MQNQNQQKEYICRLALPIDFLERLPFFHENLKKIKSITIYTKQLTNLAVKEVIL